MQVASSAADAEAAAPHTTPRDGDADLNVIDEEDVLDKSGEIPMMTKAKKMS